MTPIQRAALKEACEYGLICATWLAAFVEFMVFAWHGAATWLVLPFLPLTWWCAWRLARWDEHHYESRNRAIDQQRKER